LGVGRQTMTRTGVTVLGRTNSRCRRREGAKIGGDRAEKKKGTGELQLTRRGQKTPLLLLRTDRDSAESGVGKGKKKVARRMENNQARKRGRGRGRGGVRGVAHNSRS